MAVSLAVSEIFSGKEWRDLKIFVWGLLSPFKMAPFDRPYDFLFVSFPSSLALTNIVTVNSGLEITQCHLNWYHSIACTVFYSPSTVLSFVSFPRYSEVLTDNCIFIPPAFAHPVRWVRVTILPYRSVRLEWCGYPRVRKSLKICLAVYTAV